MADPEITLARGNKMSKKKGHRRPGSTLLAYYQYKYIAQRECLPYDPPFDPSLLPLNN